jgi:hypothetical protein
MYTPVSDCVIFASFDQVGSDSSAQPGLSGHHHLTYVWAGGARILGYTLCKAFSVL